MLRKFLDWQLSLFQSGTRLHRLRPLVSAADTFCFEPDTTTQQAPHVRDASDAKRWMILVVVALIPVIIMAVWNTGVQKYVYTSGDFQIMRDYLVASTSFSAYFDFCFSDGRWLKILGDGLSAFLPIMIISYAVGGAWEAFFAVIRRHEIAEGFLVTGMLYALILPPTMPYWMVAFGVSAGVVIGKELFGGTGMNILNPALTCRVFLFFTFPGQITGEVWVGTNPTVVAQSLRTMNEEAKSPAWDGFTQATPLAKFNVGTDVKRVHVDAIAANLADQKVPTSDVIAAQWARFESKEKFGELTGEQLQEFVTSPVEKGGLGLIPDSFDSAYQFAKLRYGVGENNIWNLSMGNRPGSLGETWTLGCILGAIFLIGVGIGSWRTMVAFALGAAVTAGLFQWGSTLGVDGGAWNPAKFDFPFYKHLVLGGLAFGLVYMATDPVSSAALQRSRWYYGILIGVTTLIIRIINPAYPEGVMLAILFGNVFAPLMDYYVVRSYTKRRVRV
jgi:Na+-transporting NADH:ubiquinone oxidoreductase subunit B